MSEQTISPQRAVGDVHLVGSLPFPDAESAFRAAAKGLGDRIAGLPDGEPGQRKFWVNYMPQFIFSNHPDLTAIHIPDAGGPEAQPEADEGVRPGPRGGADQERPDLIRLSHRRLITDC